MMKILGARARRLSLPRPLGRHDWCAPRRRRHRLGGQPGQTLVIFALASLVLMGVLGLVLDSGYDLAQRRAMQNAADAAALMGTRDILSNAKWLQGFSGASQITTTQLYNDVLVVAQQNGLQDATKLRCELVTNAGNGESSADDGNGNCNKDTTSAISATATGVRVSVSESHTTFVMRVVGIGTSGTGATATAHAEALSYSGLDIAGAPFIVCGYQTYTTTSDGKTLLTPKSILVTNSDGTAKFDGNGQPQFNTGLPNPDPNVNIKIGQPDGDWFDIHDSPRVAECGAQNGAGFKGVNAQNPSDPKTATQPGVGIHYDTGIRSGPIGQAVGTINGCAKGSTTFDNCYMMLPIADNAVVGTPSDKKVNVVGWALFLVKDVSNGNSNNHHIAQLADNAAIQANGTLTLDPTVPSSVTVLRLTK